MFGRSVVALTFAWFKLIVVVAHSRGDRLAQLRVKLRLRDRVQLRVWLQLRDKLLKSQQCLCLVRIQMQVA